MWGLRAWWTDGRAERQAGDECSHLSCHVSAWDVRGAWPIGGRQELAEEAYHAPTYTSAGRGRGRSVQKAAGRPSQAHLQCTTSITSITGEVVA